MVLQSALMWVSGLTQGLSVFYLSRILHRRQAEEARQLEMESELQYLRGSHTYDAAVQGHAYGRGGLERNSSAAEHSRAPRTDGLW